MLEAAWYHRSPYKVRLGEPAPFHAAMPCKPAGAAGQCPYHMIPSPCMHLNVAHPPDFYTSLKREQAVEYEYNMAVANKKLCDFASAT